MTLSLTRKDASEKAEKWQRKLLTADRTSTGVMTDLSYTLEVGKVYDIVLNALCLTGTGGTVTLNVKDGATVIGRMDFNDSSNVRESASLNLRHTMVNTALTFEVVTMSVGGAAIDGNNTLSETHVIVTEKPNLQSFSGW